MRNKSVGKPSVLSVQKDGRQWVVQETSTGSITEVYRGNRAGMIRYLANRKGVAQTSLTDIHEGSRLHVNA